MPIPQPKGKEKKKAFISRCADEMSQVDPDRPNDQRLGICYSEWDNHMKRKRKRMQVLNKKRKHRSK